MACVPADTERVAGRGLGPGGAMSLGSREQEEVPAVRRDSSRRCAQRGMAAVFSSTAGRLPPAILWPLDAIGKHMIPWIDSLLLCLSRDTREKQSENTLKQ